MFEPVGNKSSHQIPKMMEKIICPTDKTPFIFTNINSHYYYKTGYQDINKLINDNNNKKVNEDK